MFYLPSFLYIQTVSKETTGPPTAARSRSGADTNCVDKYEQVWNTESLSMTKVCVKVCTTATYEGDKLIETEVSHSDCQRIVERENRTEWERLIEVSCALPC